MAFQLIYTTDTLGDCTRCYDVYFSETYTVAKFVKEIAGRVNNFGTIYIENIYGNTLTTIDYRHGEASEIPYFLQNRLIRSASGNGGYSCYGYTLVVND